MLSVFLNISGILQDVANTHKSHIGKPYTVCPDGEKVPEWDANLQQPMKTIPTVLLLTVTTTAFLDLIP